MSRRGSALAFAGLVIVVIVGSVAPGSAGPPQWWRTATVQVELGLTREQIATIDHIFHSDLPERRRLAREQEALEARLNAALLDAVVEDQDISRLIDQVVRLQARRNAYRTRMLLRMYRVLTAEQRSRFATHELLKGP